MHLTSAFPFFALLHSLLSSDQQKIVETQEQGVSSVSQKGKRKSQHLFYLFENNVSALYAHIVHPMTSFSSLFTPQESEVTHSSGWLPDMSRSFRHFITIGVSRTAAGVPWQCWSDIIAAQTRLIAQQRHHQPLRQRWQPWLYLICWGGCWWATRL